MQGRKPPGSFPTLVLIPLTEVLSLVWVVRAQGVGGEAELVQAHLGGPPLLRLHALLLVLVLVSLLLLLLQRV